MAYSHTRLHKTLAVVRMLTGMLFLVFGAHKISSWDFGNVEFPQFLWDATHGGAAGFYSNFLNSFVLDHPGGCAVLVGLTELFIGVGLLLGLAVRPISLVGMLYTVNLALATWMAPGERAPLWRYLDNEAKLILLFFLFLLFGIGHAGENWGLGALYHRHRQRAHGDDAEVADLEPVYDVYHQRYRAEDELLRDWELSRRSLQHGNER